MLTELRGKGGCVCQAAREGKIRCPLIVRPTSEDVITGELFQTLGAITPRWWLPDLLALGLAKHRFPQRIFRKLTIELWQKRSPFPRELIPWNEGGTEVDVTLRWENPPTTLFIEMKFGSPIATTTTGNDGHHSLPADQLARNIRVGLHECGYYRGDELFAQAPRDFAILVIAPDRNHPLVNAYRSSEQVRQGMPRSERLIDLPRSPFVGIVSYGEIVDFLSQNFRWMTRTEQHLSSVLIEYLLVKQEQFRRPKLPFSSSAAELF
jgi:hypothetical protein